MVLLVDQGETESFVSAGTKVTFTGCERGLCNFKYGDAY